MVEPSSPCPVFNLDDFDARRGSLLPDVEPQLFLKRLDLPEERGEPDGNGRFPERAVGTVRDSPARVAFVKFQGNGTMSPERPLGHVSRHANNASPLMHRVHFAFQCEHLQSRRIEPVIPAHTVCIAAVEQVIESAYRTSL